ncbi:hypothetical protein I5U73_03170 [Stenotrophomonas maltophilia]|nr:hypothetical protein [Stenotrophomonas maltophilia]
MNKYTVIRVDDASVGDFESYDLNILAVTGESRAWAIPDKFIGSRARTWVLVRRNETLANDDLSAEVRRRLPLAEILEADTLSGQVAVFLSSFAEDKRARIFIDISCMTRRDMAELLNAMFPLEGGACELELTIGYVVADFTPPPSSAPRNEFIGPLSPRFAGWPSNPSASTALVLGLGYEAAKAEGAHEYFDAIDNWVFFPESPITQYDDEVLTNNRQLVELADRNSRLFRYRVDSPAELLSRLSLLVLDHSSSSNLVILPFGPKIFVAASLIAAIISPSVGVWHATGDTDLPADDHFASKYIVGMKVIVAKG